jgi:hypothetical protein
MQRSPPPSRAPAGGAAPPADAPDAGRRTLKFRFYEAPTVGRAASPPRRNVHRFYRPGAGDRGGLPVAARDPSPALDLTSILRAFYESRSTSLSHDGDARPGERAGVGGGRRPPGTRGVHWRSLGFGGGRCGSGAGLRFVLRVGTCRWGPSGILLGFLSEMSP